MAASLSVKILLLALIIEGFCSTGSASTVYTRWGRTVCEGHNSELVYKGYVGSSHYTHRGGGSNYICLTDSPNWDHTGTGYYYQSGYLYGTEYELGRTNWPFSSQERLQDGDAPCAVCEAVGQSASLMIPGTNICPEGWHEQYKGYIVAGHYGQQRNEHICLDTTPETVPGSSTNMNGALFYFTMTQCGALPCPPYKSKREITCVVCTK